MGVATNNVAEYRAFILGLRFALEKGFTSVRVRGDSKLVCMQVSYQPGPLLYPKKGIFLLIVGKFSSHHDSVSNLSLRYSEWKCSNLINFI